MKFINNKIYLLLILAAISCDNATVTPEPEPEPEVEDEYAACFSDLSVSTLDIATWNIQNFSI